MKLSQYKKFFTVITVLALSASVISPASSAIVEDEQMPSQFSSTPGLKGFELDEVSGLRDNVSVLIGSDATGQKICTSAAVAPCNSADGYSFRAVLGPCTSDVTIDCIEGVSATSSDGANSNASFKEFFPARGVTDYTGSPSESVPDGRPPSLWTLAGAPHGYGSDYEVTVQVMGSKVNGDATKPLRSLFASITPVSIFQTACDVRYNGHCMDTFREEIGTDGKTKLGFAGVAADQDAGIRCLNWGENSKCALKHAFPAGVKFSLKIRLSSTPTGWLHGRLQDPTASIERSEGVTNVSISAEPTKVPVVSGVGQWTALPANIQAWFTDNCANVRCGTRRPNEESLPIADRNIISGPAAFSAGAFTQLALWKTYTGDKAVAMPSQWSVRTLSYAEMQNAPSCIKNGVGVTGIVATNASAYAEGPPAYDSATSTLNYKVAAPHYQKDGATPFTGRYDLVLRSDIANCLYGVSDSNSEATVSVAGEDGVAKSASTTFSFNNGWFKFSASGFTHSAPTVKVKLSRVYPTVGKGKKISVVTAAKKNSIVVPKGATVRVKVAKDSLRKCSVLKNMTVKGLAKGTCSLILYVTPQKSKVNPKPKTTRSGIRIIVMATGDYYLVRPGAK